MLVLRRKAGEAIVLNGAITIYVLAVEGERVKLGISAPPEVVIVRSELLEGPLAGPGGPAGGPMSGPLGGPQLPPGGSGSSYPRPPRPPSLPERSWREPDRSWRESEPPIRPPRPPMPPIPPRHEPDEDSGDPSGYGGPTRYTPRGRYDTYGSYGGSPEDYEESAPTPGDDQDPLRRR
jgi:carbon storage regulator